jgi:hypothetical protein
MAEVNIFNACMLSEFCFSQAGFQTTIFAIGHFAIYQKPQAFFKTQLIDIRHSHLLFQGSEHAVESQFLEIF